MKDSTKSEVKTEHYKFKNNVQGFQLADGVNKKCFSSIRELIFFESEKQFDINDVDIRYDK